MAEPLGRLLHWSDPSLGDLAWDEADLVWIGKCVFNGRDVQLRIDPDRTDPTRAEQLAVIEPSRSILARLLEHEPELRRQAAQQLAAAVISQQQLEQDLTILPVDRFADGLELEVVSIHGCGELHYRCPEFFSGSWVTIYFNDDLSFGDSEVYEVRRGAQIA